MLANECGIAYFCVGKLSALIPTVSSAMGFLSPYLLATAAVFAVPLWLHLRRKRRQTPVEFPSLRYLKMTAARMKRQARVEDPVLLFLRLLLLVLLAAAFARPVVRSGISWLGAGRSVESVVVIDATASMGWHGESGIRLDAAKRLAREWVDGLAGSDAVALWVLTDHLEKSVPVPITDRAHWFCMLDAVKPSEGSCSLAPVFQAAREWAEARAAGRRELVMLTDNQPAAWDWPAEGFFRRSWQRSGISLVVLVPDTAKAANVNVTSVEWHDHVVRGGTLLSGVAKLANYGAATVSDFLECRVKGQVLFRKTVEIPAGGSIEVPVSVPVQQMDGPVFSGELALAGDALACDDHWWFCLPARHPGKALVVDRSGGLEGVMRTSFFLTKALAAGGIGKAQTVDSDAFTKQATEGFDSLWFTTGVAAGAGAWEKALSFADGGGTVVVFADSQPDVLPNDWPVTSGEETSLPAGRLATRLLVPAHPMFEGVWDVKTPFPPLSQKNIRNCAATAKGTVLATLAGGFPFIVELSHGKGRVFWINASADRSWGDLPLSQIYVPLVQQMARAGELSMKASTSCWVGESWPDLSKISSDASWPAAEDGGSASRAVHSGVFDALSKEGRSLWSCAVNVRRAESDLRPLDPAKLQAILPGRVSSGSQGIREWREESRHEVPLWPWLLAAAGGVYLTEGWLSVRLARRREHAAGGSVPVGSQPRGKAQWWVRRAGT